MTNQPEDEQQDEDDDWVESISLEEVEEGGDDDYQSKVYRYWLALQQDKEEEE